MNVKAQKLQSLYAPVGNHWHESTIERHSLGHALAGVPAPSEREPGRVVPFIRPPGNQKVSGDFHRPYETQKSLHFTIQRTTLPQSRIRSTAPSEREPGMSCTIHSTVRKPQGYGRFSSPLRDSECFTFLVQAVLCYYNSADSRGGNLRNKCFYDLFNLHRRLRSLSTLSAFWASWRIAILSPSTMADCRLSTAADKSKSISASASLLTGSL